MKFWAKTHFAEVVKTVSAPRSQAGIADSISLEEKKKEPNKPSVALEQAGSKHMKKFISKKCLKIIIKK